MPAASPLFSIVSPVYRAEATVGELVRRLVAAVTPLSADFEILLVDDRSVDGSWAIIQAEAARDPRIRGLRLSRNFGQHRAITAGLDVCRGEWVVVLDCDLQDQPEEIPALFTHAQKGYDVVLARRTSRQDTWAKRLSSWMFHRLLAYLTGTRHDPAVGNFGLYHRRVIAAVLSMRESIRFFPTMVHWVGFRTSTVDVVHAPRVDGRSTYTVSALLRLMLDIVLAYSDKPLRLAMQAGLLLAGAAFLMVPITLVRYLAGQIRVLGYTSLLISIWFLGGLLLAGLGLVGLYVGRTFEQVKSRPLYIIDEVTAAEPSASVSSNHE